MFSPDPRDDAPPASAPGARAGPVVVSNTTGAADWDDYVARRPKATSYHRWAWRSVFERAFGHETEYLSARRSGHLVGILPLVMFRTWLFGRFAVSLPFVNYGGVVADDREAADALLTHATEMARRAQLAHVELRHTAREYSHLPFKQHKVAMTLALPPSAEMLWNGFDRKVRNQVRKAEKSGLVVVSGHRELLPAFYSVFARNMRDLGTPVYSQRFFSEMFNSLGDALRLFTVRHQNTTVAAALALHDRGTVEVPWASSLAEYRAMSPNNVMYWALIEAAVRAGARTFDFGRSTPDSGTYHFKKQWGAVAVPLTWEYALLAREALPDQSPQNPRFGLMIDLWKRLPVPVANVLGPPLVKSIP